LLIYDLGYIHSAGLDGLLLIALHTRFNWRVSEASETLLSLVNGKMQYMRICIYLNTWATKMWCGRRIT